MDLNEMNLRLKNIESLLFAQKNVLNLDEVCTLTGLSKSHLYKLTCYKQIPFYKQAKHCFFDRIEVENWLKENRCQTSEEVESKALEYVTLNQKGGKK